MARTKQPGSKSIRQQAAELVYEIMENGAYTNLLLEKRLRNSKKIPADRRLLTEMVNGTVRMVKHLDWVLNSFLSRDMSAQNPWLRTILRISSYQILFMDRVPAYAVVNEAVIIGENKCGSGLARVINGVLRNLLRQQESIVYPVEEIEQLSVCCSHPEWMVRLFRDRYGIEACRQILAFDNKAPRLILRSNSLLSTAEELLEDLKAEGVNCRLSPLMNECLQVERADISSIETRAFQSGRFYIQSEAAALTPVILQAQPGQLIYDLCCGVGGKSTHLGEIMKNQGEVRAFDLYEQKIKLLEANCRRMGIKNVKARAVDIKELDGQLEPGQGVLLDAPCSGLGVLARRADSRWRKQEQDLEELQVLQTLMMEKAADLVAAGGRLLYSTCTINPGENQEIIHSFLRNHPEFVMEGFQSLLKSWPLSASDKEDAGRGMLCLLPGKYDTDGMFYALLKKRG